MIRTNAMQLIVKYFIQRKVMKTVSVRLEWREEGKVQGVCFIWASPELLSVGQYY